MDLPFGLPRIATYLMVASLVASSNLTNPRADAMGADGGKGQVSRGEDVNLSSAHSVQIAEMAARPSALTEDQIEACLLYTSPSPRD